MKTRILGLFAAVLLAGPMSAQALTSTCGLGSEENLICDLYESGGTVTIDLGAFVGVGTLGVFETGMPNAFRNVLEFTTGANSTLLTFYFGTLPSSPFDIEIERTGDVTEWLPEPNIYRIHHDYAPTPMPEPGTLALLGLGLIGLGVARRRTSK